jgi:hypothetical protein
MNEPYDIYSYRRDPHVSERDKEEAIEKLNDYWERYNGVDLDRLLEEDIENGVMPQFDRTGNYLPMREDEYDEMSVEELIRHGFPIPFNEDDVLDDS